MTHNPAAEPHVLVVEDELRMRELLLRAIGSWGWTVSGAATAEEALRMMARSARDIVILDLNLPAMSGMQCFARIRQEWPDTQVIILTGFGDLEAARQAIRLDVVEFLTKPCRLDELEAAISRAKMRLMRQLPRVEPGPEEEMPSAPVEPSAPSPSATLEEVERSHTLSALARHGGNRAATAEELGISLRTLYYRLSEYQKQGHRID